MPGRLKMGTTGEEHQEGSRGCLIKQEPNQLQGRGVRPVQIFQDKEDRLMFSQFQQEGDDGFQGLLAVPLWGEVERRIVVFRNRQCQ